MKGVLAETKMKPGIASKGTDAKPKPSAEFKHKKGYSAGGRCSPFADYASKNPLAYGAK
jgi:hypothetical protein